ncbi:hypothetical protein EV356DRAFT_560004 [Viridothelium virens]|uniref:DDE-1 domain-containing protein n=1 Tax=Viridothelium virens TaxID=1048519 RepID=A0A6A6H7E0_VIRVR|nr:hypothetical protein EV356DRAFT_560004 [Viridothelium virens]
MAPIDEALADLELRGAKDYAATARKFGICDSTLSRRHRGLTRDRAVAQADSNANLTTQEQRVLINYINKLTYQGIPPTPGMVRVFCENITGIYPGKNWVSCFVFLHSLELSSDFISAINLKQIRAENPTQIQLYFDLITVLAAICMDGTELPPALIYSAKTHNLQDLWIKAFNPKEDLMFFASLLSSWTNKELGKAQNGKDPWLLVVNGYSSHLSMAFLNYCLKHQIYITKLPPYSTHQLQPLDVGLFSPLTQYYLTELSKWIAKHQGLVGFSKRDFYPTFKLA